MYEPLTSGFSAFAFIGFVIPLIPLYWHIKAGNAATCMYIFWASLGCLNLFINSCVWNGNMRNLAPVWCDISTRIIIAENVAIPATTLCITRQIHILTNVASGTIVNKRREAHIDLSVSLGIPLLQVVLSYIVQGHRFNIVEDFGCWPAIDDVPLAYALMMCWPLIIALVSAFFGLCATYHFFAHGRELASLLSIDRAHRGRYIRLTILASSDVFISIPVTLYDLRSNIKGVRPWISWKSVHSHFSAVDVTPASVWKKIPTAAASIEVTRWSTVLCAFMFFALFGTFSHEACERYWSAFQYARSRFGQLTSRATVSPETSERTSIPTLSSIDLEACVARPRAAVIIGPRSDTSNLREPFESHKIDTQSITSL